MVAENDTGKTNGGDNTFTTGGPPTATTDPATGIGPVSATLKGTVNPKGLQTEYFFNYGKTEAYGQETGQNDSPGGAVERRRLETGPGARTRNRIPLPDRREELRRRGRSHGSRPHLHDHRRPGRDHRAGDRNRRNDGDRERRGQPPGPDRPNTSSTTGPPCPTVRKPSETSVGAGSADVNASAQLTGLAPGTAYHFQLVAKSAGGETKGLDGTFTTESTPPPPPPPPPPGPPVTPPPLPPPPAIPPDTKITTKPPASTRDRTPTIKFSSSVAGSSFQCSVDAKPFKACRSPFTAPSLKPGRHRIRVKAVASGLIEQAPATCRFKVVAAK